MAVSGCSVDGCKGTYQARGLCRTHYSRAAREGALGRANDHCNVSDCGRAHHAKGMCELHYIRWRITGTTDPRTRITDCIVCGAPAHSRGYCVLHYESFRRYGDPLRTAHNRSGRSAAGYVLEALNRQPLPCDTTERWARVIEAAREAYPAEFGF